MENYNMDRGAPVLVRIYKEERTRGWKQDRTGKFTLLQSYPICNFSGKLGPKVAQGDYQAPEGFYDITRRRSSIERIPLIQHWFSERL